MKATKQQRKNSINSFEKDTNILEVDLKNYGECGWCQRNKEELKIPWNTWMEWKYISSQMTDKEWTGILWIEDGIVSRHQIPKQFVSSASCEIEEELGGNGIVHSHHDMGAFHSSDDNKHARNLYDYSIVLSNNSYVATRRISLPCGGLGYISVDLILINVPELNLNKISIKKFESKDNFFPSQSRESSPLSPCETCGEIRCKECKSISGQFDGEAFPFCNTCCENGLDDDCDHCWKLQRYYANYPEEEKI